MTLAILIVAAMVDVCARDDLPAIALPSRVPPRRATAIEGTEFAAQTKTMTGRCRQMMAVGQMKNGNIPDFLRCLQPVHLHHAGDDGPDIHAVIWVTPDYLSIGSNTNFLRMPLTLPSALEICRSFHCLLPTRKMVDAIYEQATCKLTPVPLPPGKKMRSIEYYVTHKNRNEEQRAACLNGELTAGHKKDVVLCRRLFKKEERIAIYGWHQRSGKPIQELSTVHIARYADYSHGVRLVYDSVWINGTMMSCIDVLCDPVLAPVVSYEGAYENSQRIWGLFVRQ